ncbi:MAG: hypothetical protein QGF74_02740 [Candidatus Nanoarchaeia archaeon]|jgi:hypothetical protein|nr:hypothetical protein [Candidatus Nanoarchaeia archaeon]|tara:strand:- start:9348 stop:9527 length:180 start_codon:yes stop_codon:yes gene_type:complete
MEIEASTSSIISHIEEIVALLERNPNATEGDRIYVETQIKNLPERLQGEYLERVEVITY